MSYAPSAEPCPWDPRCCTGEGRCDCWREHADECDCNACLDAIEAGKKACCVCHREHSGQCEPIRERCGECAGHGFEKRVVAGHVERWNCTGCGGLGFRTKEEI